MIIKRVFSFAEPTAEELDQKINDLLRFAEKASKETVDNTTTNQYITNPTIGQTYRTYQSNMIQVGKKQTFKNTPYFTNVVTLEFEDSNFADKFVAKAQDLLEDETFDEEEIDN